MDPIVTWSISHVMLPRKEKVLEALHLFPLPFVDPDVTAFVVNEWTNESGGKVFRARFEHWDRTNFLARWSNVCRPGLAPFIERMKY